ncbi:NUDIX domain-containing protein [Streptomyces sp. NPDC055006]
MTAYLARAGPRPPLTSSLSSPDPGARLGAPPTPPPPKARTTCRWATLTSARSSTRTSPDTLTNGALFLPFWMSQDRPRKCFQPDDPARPRHVQRGGHRPRSARPTHPASGIRLLAPGGHVESEDRTLPAAALCELAEEAGIPPGALCLTPRYLGAPIDSDVHDIEASQANGEPGTGISTSATSRRRGDAGCDFAGAGGVWCPPVGIV